MIFKSATQPLCRCCGKPIRKHTRTVYVREKLSDNEMKQDFWRYVEGVAHKKADLVKFTNYQIVSVSRLYNDKSRIGSFGEWDRESYVDEFFCSGTCAMTFAYAVAVKYPSISCTPYFKAMAERVEHVKGP